MVGSHRFTLMASSFLACRFAGRCTPRNQRKTVIPRLGVPGRTFAGIAPAVGMAHLQTQFIDKTGLFPRFPGISFVIPYGDALVFLHPLPGT